MPRYKLILEYDGTGYHGWQRQDEFMSLQQAVEEAIAKFAQHEVCVFAAGRTDAGVHALHQVIHVDLEKNWTPQKVQEATNGLLRVAGHPIAALEVSQVDEKFDARFSAVQRAYRYSIINRMAPLTVDRDRAWWIRHPLDVELMQDATEVLLGTHDFTTFRSTDCQAKSPIRSLDQLRVARVSDIEIEVIAEARAFLHNQVRSIVGSIKLVGDGRWTKADLEGALNARDRKACGPVAPACGLYLTHVGYD